MFYECNTLHAFKKAVYLDYGSLEIAVVLWNFQFVTIRIYNITQEPQDLQRYN